MNENQNVNENNNQSVSVGNVNLNVDDKKFENETLKNIQNNTVFQEQSNEKVGLKSQEKTVDKTFDKTQENVGENEKDSQQEERQVNFQAEKEKIMSLLVDGSEENISEYFLSQGVDPKEALKESRGLTALIKEKVWKEDLIAIQNEFSFVTAKTINEIPNFEKFVKLRTNGLTPIESFEGACGRLIAEQASKRRDEGSYAHLKSAGLKSVAVGDVPIPKDEVGIWKSAFPNDTMTALTKRYNKSKFKKENY